MNQTNYRIFFRYVYLHPLLNFAHAIFANYPACLHILNIFHILLIPHKHDKVLNNHIPDQNTNDQIDVNLYKEIELN